MRKREQDYETVTATGIEKGRMRLCEPEQQTKRHRQRERERDGEKAELIEQ